MPNNAKTQLPQMPQINWRIKTKRLFDFCKKLPWLAGEKVFLLFLTMIFIAIIISAVFFFKYVFLVQRQLPVLSLDLPTFNTQLLSEILKIQELRQQKLESANAEIYPEIFSPKQK